MAAPTDVAALVVTYRAGEALHECLASLRRAGAGQVLVADNGDDGAGDAVLARFPEVAYRAFPDNPGYGEAANRLLAECTAPYALVLNADTAVQPGALEALARHLDDHPRAAVVGPRLVHPDGALQPSCYPDPSPWELFLEESRLGEVLPRRRSLRRWAHDEARAVPWVLGAALALRVKAVAEVDGFDPGYFLYYEEVDLCHRLRRAGWEVHFQPAAVVTHHGGVSTSQEPGRSTTTLFTSAARFHDLHGTPADRLGLRAAVGAVMVARLARDTVRRRDDAAAVWRRVLADAAKGWPRSGPPRRSPRPRRRVLHVAPFVPDVDGAHGASRVLGGLLDATADRHDVGLVHLQGPEEPDLAPALADRLAVVRSVPRPAPRQPGDGRLGVLAGLLRGRPMWAHDWWVPAMADEVATVVEEWRPDVVHVDLVVMAPYLRAVPRSATVTVLTDHDPPVPAAVAACRQHRGARLLAHAADVVAWWWTERSALRSVDALVVFTEADRQRLAGMAGRTPVVTIPLAVRIPERPLDPLGTDPCGVVFVGGAHHPPNVDAVHRLTTGVLPRLVEAVPDVRLYVVGSHPDGSVAAGDHVVLTGRVDDVGPWLDRAAVVVAPMRLGGGMRVKVLDALAAGKAVVATPVALAGLDVAEAGGAVAAETDAELADAVAALLLDPARRVEVATRARAWAEANLTWSSRADGYERLHDRVLGAAR
ncbi:MAG TPA: glycosyltransferase [Acidimicrobiales bacterium]